MKRFSAKFVQFTQKQFTGLRLQMDVPFRICWPAFFVAGNLIPNEKTRYYPQGKSKVLIAGVEIPRIEQFQYSSSLLAKDTVGEAATVRTN